MQYFPAWVFKVNDMEYYSLRNSHVPRPLQIPAEDMV